MTDREDELETAARKLAEDKARLAELGDDADALDEDVEKSKTPLNDSWKGDVA